MSWPAPDGLGARRAVIDGAPDLQRLESALRRGLARIDPAQLWLPTRKAALTPDGGVCVADGTRLRFDPWSPDVHRCERCTRDYQGDAHDRAWIWRFHLWLTERAVHAALLGALRADGAASALARAILLDYARLYPTVPNRDNVLGPTRLFFSTYLESIWLVQVSVALTLLGDDATADACAPMVRESAALVRSFDEGWSNRQVWHNAAMVAAGVATDSDELIAVGADGRHGLRAQLHHAVTREGMWFEGENYHFFALRGLLLGAEVLRTVGVDLYAESEAGPKLAAMYRAPLRTLLPDATLPARGDAPYGVSVRQRRFAELWEIGRARTGPEGLDGILGRIYADDLPPTADDPDSDIAEQERNVPAGRVARDALGWKALAWMLPDAPEPPTHAEPNSAVLEETGVAVLRDRGRAVTLEVGGARGGHGHPDLLHLSVFDAEPVLADFGTGSYVRPSLQWYRATLAHNAPGEVGAGQRGARAWCAAFDQRNGWAWTMGVAEGVFGPDTAARRTVVMGPGFLVDGVEVEVPDGQEIDLPLHPLAGVEVAAAEPATLRAGPWPVESGYGAVTWEGTLAADAVGGTVCLVPRAGETVLVGAAPGPPSPQLADGAAHRFLVRRASGAGGWWQVVTLAGAPRATARVEGRELVIAQGERVHRMRFRRASVRITEPCGSTVRLAGARRAPRHRVPREAWRPDRVLACPRVAGAPAAGLVPPALGEGVELGAADFRRAELPYEHTSAPTARVWPFATDGAVGFVVRVRTPHLRVWAGEGPTSPDNEPPEILVDGVQCYVAGPRWRGVVAVPADDGSVRIREVGTRTLAPEGVEATWTRLADGYIMSIRVAVDRSPAVGDRWAGNLVVNCTARDRVRRVGQLCLSDGGGWVYLRGDRESPRRAAALEVS